MKLDNFDLAEPYATIELVGLGHHWDLHSWADFVGASFVPDDDEVWLEWRVPADVNNPWGSPGNMARGCRLRFRHVHHLLMTGRSESYPSKEAKTVKAVGKAIPGEGKYPFKQDWKVGEPFFLRFQFHDERMLEVGAEVAMLEAIPQHDG
jgi:hypothetical protein